MSDPLHRLLQSRPWLLADGAIGTNLFAMGLCAGESPELWNVEQPERVAALHRSFVDAGSDIILSNSFGGTRHRLALHGAEDRVAGINHAAARIAREVAGGAGREVLVAGSMGPTGELFAPLGALAPESARAAFAEQAHALAGGGADLLWIETMSSREELEAALAGAGATGLPVVCTLSFDTNGSTMMGVRPAQLARICDGLVPRPSAFGTNCGVGAAEVVVCVLNMASAAAPGSVLVAKANCGVPYFENGAIRYDGTPELMARYARLAYEAGARIIGGCCGTTPGHVRAMREALEGYPAGSPPAVDQVVELLGKVSGGAQAQRGAGVEDPGRAESRPARRGTGRRAPR